MESIDLFFGGFLVFAAYKGFRNGLFVEIASLVSLFVGLILAVKFSSFVGTWFYRYWHWNASTTKITAFFITFLGVVIGVSLLAKIFTKMANWTSLGLVNQMGGVTIRVLKTVLVLGIAIQFFTSINVNNVLVSKEKLNKSLFYQPIKSVSFLIRPLLGEVFDTFKEKIK